MVKATHLLDTNVCVQLLRGKGQDILGHLLRMQPGTAAISTITLAELSFGANLSGRLVESGRVAQLTQDFVLLPFSDQAAWEYGRLRHILHQNGTPIGALDLLIAAIACSEKLTLVTHNVAEFRRVPGLVLEDWQNA